RSSEPVITHLRCKCSRCFPSPSADPPQARQRIPRPHAAAEPMSSHASIGVERKIEHAFFLLSVWSKGVAGLLETIGGLLLLFIPHTGLNALVVFLTAPELAEDPTDRIATLLQRMVQELGTDTRLFASGYLIVHGIIK